MTIIKHFTNARNIQDIKETGLILREGGTIENAVKIYPDGLHGSGLRLDLLWREMSKQYKTVGRYVWFTEQNEVNSIINGTIAVSFDAKAIKAEPWSIVSQRLMRKSKKARSMIRRMDAAAKASGDNANKWWVTTEAVSLEKSIGLTNNH